MLATRGLTLVDDVRQQQESRWVGHCAWWLHSQDCSVQPQENKLKANETAKEKMHTASKRARKSEITESPYQELYGVQSDIYNDLRQYQK
ncbi:TYRO protein tyrosine kinase-binding protein isoform X2 [Denticeps clupeoides]|uniref:TYRO protein tyrosine kinase-binding protein isoform X2 n=1 Tax=Denticeps clupeoides TaxID=299321 RepID=UPI0010A34D0D|nr:TYRO protein tyrosine kinase-binding protein isoform X2 [Denticeps clupeoides]